MVIEIALIYFFSYFWTTVQFSPDDMASMEELRLLHPGIGLARGPGLPETVMERIGWGGPRDHRHHPDHGRGMAPDPLRGQLPRGTDC